MKPNRISPQNTTNDAHEQGQTPSELGQLGTLLGLTGQQMQALAYVAAWHGESLSYYLRVGVLGILQSSLDQTEDAEGATVAALFQELFRDSTIIGKPNGLLEAAPPEPQYESGSLEELAYWKGRASKAEAEIERLRSKAWTALMGDRHCLGARIFGAWKLSPERNQPEIFDELLDALAQIADSSRFCDLSKTRGHRQLKKELRRFRILRCTSETRKVILPVTLRNYFLKKLKAVAAIHDRSVNDFIMFKLFNAMNETLSLHGLNPDNFSLSSHQIKSLRSRAKLLHSKGLWRGCPQRN